MQKVAILLFLLPHLLFSQSDFAGEFYFNANYGPAITQSKDAFLNASGPNQFKTYESASGTLLQLETSIEYIGEHVYIYSDPGLSWAVTSLLYRFPRALLTEEPFQFEKEPIASFEFEPLRLGFGGWLNDEFGLFAGAQYSFTLISANEEFVKSKRETEDQSIIRSINGGNAKGFGVHSFYQLNKFMFQYAFMYNWISHNHGANKGKGIHQEVRVRFGDEYFGALACLEHNMIKMEAVNHTEAVDVSSYATYSSPTGSFPQTSGSILWFRLGIYFSFDWF